MRRDVGYSSLDCPGVLIRGCGAVGILSGEGNGCKWPILHSFLFLWKIVQKSGASRSSRTSQGTEIVLRSSLDSSTQV